MTGRLLCYRVRINKNGAGQVSAPVFLMNRKGYDIISPDEPESNVREESNRRSWKAGYTDRDGQPVAGKGDTYRPVNKKKYDENYEKIFGK